MFSKTPTYVHTFENPPKNYRFSDKSQTNIFTKTSSSSSSDRALSYLSERLKIASNNRLHKHARLFLRIPRRRIHDVRLHNHRSRAVCGGVERRHRLIIREAVIAADDAEADDVALVVENLEPLSAVGGGEAGDDVDLPDGADVAVAVDEVAALDEVLVRLWVVEAADDGPDGGDGGGDVVDGGGAALVGTHGVSVVARDGVRHRSGAR
ncbi:unnamed protein product [Camellia sinensis]